MPHFWGPYRTGRKRALVWSGNVSLQSFRRWPNGVIDPVEFGDSRVYIEPNGNLGGTLAILFELVSDDLFGVIPFPGQPKPRVRARLSFGIYTGGDPGSVPSPFTTGWMTIAQAGNFGDTGMQTLEGSFRIEIDVDQYHSSTVVTGGRPITEPFIEEPPSEIFYRIFESYDILKNPNIRFRAEFNGRVLTNNQYQGAISERTYPYAVQIHTNGVNSPGHTAKITNGRVSTRPMGINLQATEGAHFLDFRNGGLMRLTGTSNPVPVGSFPGMASNYGLRLVESSPSVRIHNHTRIQAWDMLYDKNLNINWGANRTAKVTSGIGIITDTIDAADGQLAAYFNKAYIDTVGSSGFIAANIEQSSLAGNGEEMFDRRLYGYGPQFPALDVKHEDELDIYSGLTGSAGWTAGPDSNVSSDGIGCLIEAESGVGSGTLNFDSPGLNGEAYRFIEVELVLLNAEEPATITMGMNDKTWQITLQPDEVLNGFIDTNFPHRFTGVFTNQDTRWPVNRFSPIADVNSNIPAFESRHWGINRTTGITFGDIPKGNFVRVTSLKFVRLNRVKACCTNTSYSGYTLYIFPHSPVNWIQNCKRVFLIDVDGRQAVEGYQNLETIKPTGTEYSAALLESMLLDINRIPGFTITSPAVLPFVPNNVYPMMVGGNGMTFDGSTFTTQLDVDLSQNPIIPGNYLWDILYLHPGAGDPVTGQGYGQDDYEPTIRWGKILRSAGHGLSGNSAKTFYKQGVVTSVIEQGTGRFGGQGTSDLYGYFRTESPFARGGHVYDYVVADGTIGSRYIPTRHLQRLVTAGKGFKSVHLCRSPFGVLFALFGAEENLTTQRFNFDGMSDTLETYQPDDSIQGAQIAWHPNGYIIVAFSEGGLVYVVENYAYADEDVWSAPVEVAAGVNPALAIDEGDGTEYVAIYDVDRWKLYRKLDGESSFSFIADIVTSSTDDSSAGLEVSPDKAGKLTFVYNDDSSNIQKLISVNRGFSWETI